MSIEELSRFYSQHSKPENRYLAELNSDNWQEEEEQHDCRRA